VELALKALRYQSRFEPTADPNTVTRGIFKFERHKEEERLRLAEDLIRRVDPGPYEDPTIWRCSPFRLLNRDGFRIPVR
jgi:hypothetical protein